MSFVIRLGSKNGERRERVHVLYINTPEVGQHFGFGVLKKVLIRLNVLSV